MKGRYDMAGLLIGGSDAGSRASRGIVVPPDRCGSGEWEPGIEWGMAARAGCALVDAFWQTRDCPGLQGK